MSQPLPAGVAWRETSPKRSKRDPDLVAQGVSRLRRPHKDIG